LQRERRLGDIHIIEFVSDDERARLGQMIWPSVLRYGRWEGETCFRHFLTGEPIDMHQHIFVVREPESGEPVAVATVSRDITQRKRAQAEVVALKDEIAVELAEMTRLHRVSMRLFESPELRTMLDDVLGAAMALQDADFGTIQLYNPEAGGLEMVAHRGFAGDFAERFFLVKGEDTVCGRAFRAGTRVIVEDVEQDAKFAPYLAMAAAEGFRAVQSTPLASHAGALLGIISTHFREPHRPTEQQLRFTDLYARQAADMIERNNVESALGKARQDLAHVARVTMMGELTASIAHEVNQPLAAVVTNANACVHWLGAPSPNASEAQAALRRIMRDANRASEVIARIRAFLLRGKPQRSAVRIEDVIREVVELLENEARAKSVSIDVSAIADVSAVMADRVQLQQVLLNLVVNAIEAMAVTSQRPRAIQIGTGPHNGDEIRVSVRDSGPGLDPKDLERVFDMFYTTKSHGMGMGLAISRSIIEAHGGRLWATAGEGGGEVFQFTLPVHAGTAA
jgi:C4-dicarboxylate-specific signal transduction histidine kinase